MSQRLWAAVLAVPLLLGLLVVAALTPLPYATYSPGTTIDLLDQPGRTETVYVRGAKTYRDDGQLRMTTVALSPDNGGLSLFSLLGAWFNPDEAVYPYSFVHPPEQTAEQEQQQGLVDMKTSQAAAAAVALRALDYKVTTAVQVAGVQDGSPATKVLRPGDVLVAVDGTAIKADAQALVDAVTADTDKAPLSLRIERGGRTRTVEVTPQETDGTLRIGIDLGRGFRFPFDVGVNIDPNIGGPSAGLMFTLAIYDTLTPGSLTQGKVVAGTGTIDGAGKVGPIGGIQQKIAGAQADGAQLFLVPADNCSDALGADTTLRLVKVTTFDSALTSIQDWVKDPAATLPQCGAS